MSGAVTPATRPWNGDRRCCHGTVPSLHAQWAPGHNDENDHGIAIGNTNGPCDNFITVTLTPPYHKGLHGPQTGGPRQTVP